MARSTWVIQTKILGGAWGNNSTIYRPNDTLALNSRTTQATVTLANGSESYFTPSTKYLKDSIAFVWYMDDGTIKTQVEGYLTNQTNLKIIDHNSNEYVGRIVSVEVVEIVGKNPDEYDIKVVFQRMSSLI